MKPKYLAFLLAPALFAATSAVADTSLYVFADANTPMHLGHDAFEGYCIGNECTKSVSQSGAGFNLGIGLVLSPKISVDLSYFDDPTITEKVPDAGRQLSEGADFHFEEAFRADPSGYRLRARYFFNVTERWDATIGTGWQKVTTEYRGGALSENTTTSLIHSAGLSYAVNAHLVWRAEYNFAKEYVTLDGLKYSDAETITLGLEFHF